MRVRYLQMVNTPHSYTPEGTERDEDDQLAEDLIAAGIAEAVQPPRKKSPKASTRKK